MPSRLTIVVPWHGLYYHDAAPYDTHLHVPLWSPSFPESSRKAVPRAWGTLRVRFVADVDAAAQARILAALRTLKATLRARPSRDRTKAWVFDTLLLPRPQPTKTRRGRVLSDRAWARRYRRQLWAALTQDAPDPLGDRAPAAWHDAVAAWNGDLWTWDRIARAEALVAAIATARSCSARLAPFPAQTKGRDMPNTPNWSDYDRDLRELHAVAADLVAGRGGPEQYRVRQSDARLLMPAFGKTALIVGVWSETYGPLAAMCVAGFILFGITFETRFARMGLTGDLVEAYDLLDRQYGPRVPSLAAPGTASLAQALETSSPASGLVKLTLTKKPQLEAPASRPALPTRRSHPALPDLGGRS